MCKWHVLGRLVYDEVAIFEVTKKYAFPMKLNVLAVVLLLSLPLFHGAFKPPKSHPTDYFAAPVEGRMLLSGGYAEIRGNHFHGGIDIKPRVRGVAGDPILASASGYIGRIVVQERGFGNGLYLVHPNGYTTVYGHLDHFHPRLDSFVRAMQYRLERFDLDVDSLTRSDFYFEQGDTIGFMGNTGSSGGVHLHFEVRDTKTEHTFNPLLFGLNVADHIAPVYDGLWVYELDQQLQTLRSRQWKVTQRGTQASVAPAEIEVQTGRIGLGVSVLDYTDDSKNWMGPSAIKVYQGDSLVFHFAPDELSFDEWYYLNAHIDYAAYQADRSRVNRCFLLPGNGNTTVYRAAPNRGVLWLEVNASAAVRIEAHDPAGNVTTLRLRLRRTSEPLTALPRAFNYYLLHNERNAIRQSHLEAYFEEETFYEDVYMQYSYSEESAPQYFTGVHHLHREDVPLHQPYVLRLRPERAIPDSLRSKAVVLRCDVRDVGYTGSWSGDFLEVRTRQWGNYAIGLDVEPPRIEALNWKSNMRRSSAAAWRVTDDLTGIATFEGRIDGRWVLLTYDKKVNKLTHVWDEHSRPGQRHTFTVRVTDGVGNVQVWEEVFVR